MLQVGGEWASARRAAGAAQVLLLIINFHILDCYCFRMCVGFIIVLGFAALSSERRSRIRMHGNGLQVFMSI